MPDPVHQPHDACSIDRVSAILVQLRDAVDGAAFPGPAFAAFRGDVQAALRYLAPIGTHPVRPPCETPIDTGADFAARLLDAHGRMVRLILDPAIEYDQRLSIATALRCLDRTSAAVLGVIGDAARDRLIGLALSRATPAAPQDGAGADAPVSAEPAA